MKEVPTHISGANPENSLEQRSGDSFYFNVHTRSEVIPPATEDITALEVGCINVPEGEIYPMQQSYFCSLAWCERGGFTALGKGWSFEVQSGEVAVLDTGIHHSTCAGKEGAEGYYLLVDGSRCHELLRLANLWPGAFRYRETPRDWLNQIATCLRQKDRQAMASHIAYQVFLQVGEQVAENFPNPLLWKACLHVQTHWSEESLTVESVLARMGVSRSNLSTLFKEHLGVSILKYINSVRLGHAKRLLTEGLQPISELATACGFRNASHFSSWFRKQTGVIPSRFRESGA